MADYEQYHRQPQPKPGEMTLEWWREVFRGVNKISAPIERNSFIEQHDCRALTTPEYAAWLAVYEANGGQVSVEQDYDLPRLQLDDAPEGTPAPYWLVRRPFKWGPHYHSPLFPLNVALLEGLTKVFEYPWPPDDDSGVPFTGAIGFRRKRTSLYLATVIEPFGYLPDKVESFSDVRRLLSERPTDDLRWAQTILKGLADEVDQRKKLPLIYRSHMSAAEEAEMHRMSVELDIE